MVIMAGCNIFLVTEYIKFRNQVTTGIEKVNVGVETLSTKLESVSELPEFSTDSLKSKATDYLKTKFKKVE